MRKSDSLQLKKLLCLLLSFCVFVLSFSFPASALSDAFKSKIDSCLQRKIETANETDKISVSVWLNDINHDLVKSKTVSMLNALLKKGEVSQKAIDLVFAKDIKSTHDISVIKGSSTVTVNEMQKIISAERKVLKQAMKANNKSGYDAIQKDLNSQSELISISTLAPCLYLYLTKSQIQALCYSSSIVSLNYYDESLQFIDCDEEEPEYDEDLNWDFLDVTGLSTARDDYNLDGTNMKVGILEADVLPRTWELPNSNITNVYGSVYGFSPANTHGTKVASVMVANHGDFLGAIPNAHLYASVLQAGTAGIDSDIDLLLAYDVTAINLSCSPSHFENPYDLNGYDDFAMYLDYISVNYDVTFVMSSGNFGDEGIGSSNMAYNALIVGSCSNQGEKSDFSSYNSSPPLTFRRYKPDLVAPGEKLATVMYTDPFTGTSASTPLVTSAVIQLTQAKPELIGKSQLIKSILLSSSTITSSMDSAEVISTTSYGTNKMSYSKKYGSGMLDMVKAYETACVNETYHYESMPVARPAIVYNEYIDAQNQQIRFSMCWDKINTETYSYDPDSLTLRVTDPNNNVYESNFLFDNKQMITIQNAPSGTYRIDIFRNHYENSYQPFKLGFSYSVS